METKDLFLVSLRGGSQAQWLWEGMYLGAGSWMNWRMKLGCRIFDTPTLYMRVEMDFPCDAPIFIHLKWPSLLLPLRLKGLEDSLCYELST